MTCACRTTQCSAATLLVVLSLSAQLMPTCFSADTLEDLLNQADSVPSAAHGTSSVDSPPLAIPSATDRKNAIDKVREVFADEFAQSTTAVGKKSLADQLATEAGRSHDAVERWALLRESLRLASEAGDMPGALAAIERLSVAFPAVPPEEKLDALLVLAAKAPANEAAAVVQAMLEPVRLVIEKGDEEVATKSLAVAAGLARKAKHQSLTAEVAELQSIVKERAKERKTITAFEERLKKAPQDPAICLEAGKFYCFRLQDWKKGLPLLAAGKDASLAAIAKQDLGSRGEVSAIRHAADEWWDWSEDQPAAARDAARLRAGKLYEAILDTVAGLEKTKLEKRIASALTNEGSRAARPRATVPGTILWLDSSVVGSVQVQGESGQGFARVLRWRDLSGKGNDAIAADPALMPSWKKPSATKGGAVIFDGKTALAVNMPCEVSGSILAVFVPALNTANMRAIGAMAKPGEFVGISLRNNGSIWAEASSRGVSAVLCQSQPGAYAASEPIVVGQTWGEGLMVWRNATPAGPEMAIAPGVQMRGPWGLGGATLGLHVEYFSGEILEVLVFDRELPAKEMATLSAEKMRKWRIQ